MKYIPYSELDGVANIVVDGAAHPDTEIILSHWSNSGTAPALIRDTSAEIVFDYLEQHTIPDHLQVVSNNHFDQDGLVSVFALTYPELAQRHRALLIDVAEAGDFGKYQDDRAAKIAILIAVMTSPESRFFDESVFSQPYAEMAACFYQEILKIMPTILEDVDVYQALWRDEFEFLTASTALVKDGVVVIEEDFENDLAIVSIPEDIATVTPGVFDPVRHFGAIHEFAVHNATLRGRLLYVQGRRIQFKYRYETWVQLKNNIHPLRVNLSPLASRLSELDDVSWHYTGSDDFAPMLYSENQQQSSISLEKFVSMLKEILQSGEVDWFPYPESA